MSAPFAMNSYRGKQILALVRGADFAHAGEEEAIDRALRSIPKDKSRRILDAGCGRGGTAAYMQSHGWGRVTGFDIEPNSIAYARSTYPEVTFEHCDIADVAAHVPDGFDIVTLFNVLYALPDQPAALRALAGRAGPGARLVLFDYVDPGTYQDAPLMDAGRPFLPRPLPLSGLASLLENGGWRLTAVEDLKSEYERWYQALVQRIEANRDAIAQLADTAAYAHVLALYAGLLAAVRDGRLSGALIYGERLLG